MLQKFQERVKAKPLATISTIVGTLSGIIAIIAFAGTVIDKVDEMVVSPEELTASEERIIDSIRDEAVLTRGAILTILEARKDKLQDDMEALENAGKTIQAEAVLKELLKLKEQIIQIRDAQ